MSPFVVSFLYTLGFAFGLALYVGAWCAIMEAVRAQKLDRETGAHKLRTLRTGFRAAVNRTARWWAHKRPYIIIPGAPEPEKVARAYLGHARKVGLDAEGLALLKAVILSHSRYYMRHGRYPTDKEQFLWLCYAYGESAALANGRL